MLTEGNLIELELDTKNRRLHFHSTEGFSADLPRWAREHVHGVQPPYCSSMGGKMRHFGRGSDRLFLFPARKGGCALCTQASAAFW